MHARYFILWVLGFCVIHAPSIIAEDRQDKAQGAADAAKNSAANALKDCLAFKQLAKAEKDPAEKAKLNKMANLMCLQALASGLAGAQNQQQANDLKKDTDSASDSDLSKTDSDPEQNSLGADQNYQNPTGNTSDASADTQTSRNDSLPVSRNTTLDLPRFPEPTSGSQAAAEQASTNQSANDLGSSGGLTGNAGSKTADTNKVEKAVATNTTTKTTLDKISNGVVSNLTGQSPLLSSLDSAGFPNRQVSSIGNSDASARGFFAGGTQKNTESDGHRKIKTLGGDPDGNDASVEFEGKSSSSNDDSFDAAFAQLLGGGQASDGSQGSSSANQIIGLQSGDGTGTTERAPTIFEFVSFRIKKLTYNDGRIKQSPSKYQVSGNP